MHCPGGATQETFNPGARGEKVESSSILELNEKLLRNNTVLAVVDKIKTKGSLRCYRTFSLAGDFPNHSAAAYLL